MFFYSVIRLLCDFVEAYIEEPFNTSKRVFNAICEIVHDIKFWLVFCIITVIGIIPFGILLTHHENLKNSKIDAHILLHDGREFQMKKSDIHQHGDIIEFTVNGETIETTLYTITYK